MGFMPGNSLNADKNGFIKISSLAMIGIFLLIYIAPLGVFPITIPDEARYSEIPKEMIASGIVSGEHLLSSACWFYD